MPILRSNFLFLKEFRYYTGSNYTGRSSELGLIAVRNDL